ncbi:MAG: DUF1343 domain-containing protein [Bacteroidales bacterium]|nr:DUF1343 domain-containing protein [Bacteroidales bacterium]MBN2757745.1 DUF1343 domain-containing protein [Bacteroidales bacterium]
MKKYLFLILLSAFISSCGKSQENKTNQTSDNKAIITGAEQSELYLDLLKNKKIALVVNQSSLVKGKHLLDFLIENKIKIVKIFAPEHGFRGNIDRGAHINNEIDEKTGVPIISMFGKNKRPTKEQLQDIDILIFDIQDAGARFFTYISSMHEVMEACAQNKKPLIILDRPNPLGDYVDGPVMQEKFKSFVGMHKIPIVHGLTVGELAQMINGESWLENNNKCELKIIKVKNYNHKMQYILPVKPSPNLPNQLSIRLYPSLCFFEATNISIGRGTEFPFQVIGFPDKIFGDSLFIPKDIEGMQINPVQEGKICYGIDLRDLIPENQHFTLKYLINFYIKSNLKDNFFSRPKWFNLLAGNNILVNQIKNGLSEEEIKKTWEKELTEYKKIRKKYLLYADFE